MLIIALEGIEGSGKTVQAKLLDDYLRSQGFRTVLLKEPSKFLAGVIKEQRDASSAEINGLLFAADRLKQFSEVVKPALKKHKMVVMDRSVFSSFAYQSAQGASLEWLETINKYTPLPDLAIVLDIPPEVGLKRVEERDEISNFDKMVNEGVLQGKVRFAYHLLAERYADRIAMIEVAGKSIQEVQTLIWKVVSATSIYWRLKKETNPTK